MSKVCGRCKIKKSDFEFHRDKRRLDGLYPYCKDCRREYMGCEPQSQRDVTGQRFGKLLVLGKGKPYYFLVRCNCGREKEVYGPSLWRNGKNRTVSCGQGDCKLRQESPTYNTVHLRVRQRRGPARNFDCKHCGGRAQHWSYDHSDTDPLHEQVGKYLIEYSGDWTKYHPLCVPCHKKFDTRYLKEQE